MQTLTDVFSFDNRRYSVVHPGRELSLTNVSNSAFWGCRVTEHTPVSRIANALGRWYWSLGDLQIKAQVLQRQMGLTSQLCPFTFL